MRTKKLFLCLVMGLVFVFASNSHAAWELYDDFNAGTDIDLTKWNKKATSGTISIENQQAKFVHAADHPNDSLYLLFNQNPDTISGIKATITVASCTGDVRARITGYGGKVGDDHVWSAVQLQDSMDRIYTSVGLEGPPPTYTWVKDLQYAQFQRPITVVGNTYVVSMLFFDDKIAYEVTNGGKIIYTYATEVDPATDFFRAIGTRSSNGDGPCTVYFDDVYVFRP